MSVSLILMPISYSLVFIIPMAYVFLSRNCWSSLDHDLMASICEKDNSILAENLNSGGSYLITAVTVLYFIVSCLIQVLLEICNLLKGSHFFYSTILLKHPSCQKQYNLEIDLWLSLSQCDFLSMNQDVCKVERGVILDLLQNVLDDLKRYKNSYLLLWKKILK